MLWIYAVVYYATLYVGKSLGAMDGLSYAVKDNLTTKNIPTTCGSAFLKGKMHMYM